jgi:predicted metal-dependent peptidase
MELTLLKNDDGFESMVVSQRELPAKGLALFYNKAFVDGLSDIDLHTVLCHEAQHIRRNDLQSMQAYLAERDWYNGWDGAELSNVAADLQINDYLEELTYPRVKQGLYGTDLLGHDTHKMLLEDVMREVAAKIPPRKSMGDVRPSPGSVGQGEEEALDMHAEAGKKASAKSRSRALLANGQDVARWGNFLKEILDVRKQEDTWQRLPKRLAGVDAYQDREYVRPAVRPLPRKHALVAIDVSGSMDERLVGRLLSAVRNSPANYDLQVVTFNTEVFEWKDFRTNAEIPNMGGGTELGPVLQHVRDLRVTPERILVLTDGHFSLEPGSVPSPQNWIFSIYGAFAEDFQAAHGLRAVQMERLLP